MLVNPNFKKLDDERIAEITTYMREEYPHWKWRSPEDDLVIPVEGILISPVLNLTNHIDGIRDDGLSGFFIDCATGEFDEFPDGDKKMSYGVCDDYRQVLDLYAAFIQRPDIRVFVLLTPIYREPDGWHWHNWGEKIGVLYKKDYLNNEPPVDVSYIYSLYVLEEAHVER